MKYANWVTSEMKAEHQSAMKEGLYQEIEDMLCKLLESELTKKALKSFSRGGYDAYTFRFIHMIASGPLARSLARPEHSFLGAKKREEKIEEGIRITKRLTVILKEFNIDLSLYYWLRIREREILSSERLRAGFTQEMLETLPPIELETSSKTLFLRDELLREKDPELDESLPVSMTPGRHNIQLSDALSFTIDMLEDIRCIAPLVIKQNSHEDPVVRDRENKRQYFIRNLYIEFMRDFGRPFTSAIVILSEIFLLDDGISETMVIGSTNNFKKQLKAAGKWESITSVEKSRRYPRTQ